MPVTEPLARLNAVIKWQRNVVGIFPDDVRYDPARESAAAREER